MTIPAGFEEEQAQRLVVDELIKFSKLNVHSTDGLHAESKIKKAITNPFSLLINSNSSFQSVVSFLTSQSQRQSFSFKQYIIECEHVFYCSMHGNRLFRTS
jgi:hypothetical protein